MTRIVVCVALLLVCVVSWSATYQVTTPAKSGVGSLKWAIGQANSNPGADDIIFVPTMAGQIIKPTASLPAITDDGTRIYGDINGNGVPDDVALSGRNLPEGAALRILGAERCVVSGLTIYKFKGYGVRLEGARFCKVRGCNFGTNLAGTKAVGPQGDDVFLEDSHKNTIGGTSAAARNIFARGNWGRGVYITDGKHNKVVGNYFGLARDGSTKLGIGRGAAIIIQGDGPGLCGYNTVGGTTPGERNVFGRVGVALDISGADHNTFQGNYVGLAADGLTAKPLRDHAISIGVGAKYNLIGGTTPGAGNVIAAASRGVEINGSGNRDNKVQGNIFGTNAPGTKQFDILHGVLVWGGAGRQTIGGSTPAAGNTVVCRTAGYWSMGVQLGPTGGKGSMVQNNKFGVRPDGKLGTSTTFTGIRVDGVKCSARKNEFVRLSEGIKVTGTGGYVTAIGNLFRRCNMGVWVLFDGQCMLGNLGNADPTDNGNNTFQPSNTYHIYNGTARKMKAEGNSFGTTLQSAINAKIFDKKDDPTKGKVDFDPLNGGVSPTGGILGVSGVAAIPTTTGVELAFTLSAEAAVTVTVSNLAGRRVATVTRAAPLPEGLQRLAWDGRGDTGTAVPGGRYLVSIEARTEEGQVARALAPVVLGR